MRLEDIFESELQLAHLERCSGRKNRPASHGVSNLPKVRRRFCVTAAPACDRTSQRGMIRGVECLKAELKTLSFSDREILDRREIQSPNAGAGQNISPHVPELAGSQIGESSYIEPLVGALLIRRQIRIDTGRVQPVLVSNDDLAGGVPTGKQVERAAALGRENAAGLPATYQLVEDSSAIKKALAFPQWHIVNDRRDQARRRIEGGRSILA